jgi:hypothetical protein
MLVDLATFTFIHTAISLIALVLGVPAIGDLIGKPATRRTTTAFIVFALATSLTGFMFPFNGITPAFAVGVIATLVLVVTIYARYGRRAVGPWRWIYAIGIVISEFFLAFVTIVQSFLKIPSLHALAPTGSEPPFAAAQGVLLIATIALGFLAVRRYRPAALG